jgi:uncharacterized protein
MIPELIERKTDLESLCRRLGVRRLEVFGSAATGRFRPEDSDIDFLVEFEPAAIHHGYADRYFGLLESLEQLFGRSVDLVVDSAIRSPYFRQSVDRTKVLLYAA